MTVEAHCDLRPPLEPLLVPQGKPPTRKSPHRFLLSGARAFGLHKQKLGSIVTAGVKR